MINPKYEKTVEKRITATQKKFLELYDGGTNNIAFSCVHAGISRRTYYNWLEKHPKFKEAIEDSREGLIDRVESKFITKALQGDDTIAMIFFLKTKGKSRGYIEKNEVDVSFNPFMRLMQSASVEGGEYSAYQDVGASVGSPVKETEGSSE